ncbi:MAG: hypothetical protein WED09_13770 [Homoserinimonas sp.]
MAQEIQPARDILTARCMREAGFDVPQTQQLPPSDRFNVSGLSGLSSPTLDSQLGYASTVDGLSPSDALDSLAQTLEPQQEEAYRTALVGPVAEQMLTAELENGGSLSFPSEGCLVEADLKLYGDLETSISIVVLMNDVLFLADHTIVTEAIRHAKADYNLCMQEAGYDIGTASASSHAADLFGRYKPVGSPPSRDEESLLEADQTCQLQSEMHLRTSNAFYTANDSWVLSETQAIRALAEASMLAEERANAVVAQLEVAGDANLSDRQ